MSGRLRNFGILFLPSNTIWTNAERFGTRKFLNSQYGLRTTFVDSIDRRSYFDGLLYVHSYGRPAKLHSIALFRWSIWLLCRHTPSQKWGRSRDPLIVAPFLLAMAK
jgi:hypothetical protein